MTKILFLDVDGVLNYKSCKEGKWPMVLCSRAISRLCRIIDETGCKIVMSSTWRLHEHDAMKFLKNRCPRLEEAIHEDWRTPYGTADEIRLSDVKQGFLRHVRGTEINIWLGRHPEVTKFAIVDDDSDMLPDQLTKFVKTSWETGMLDSHAEQLISILGEKDAP